MRRQKDESLIESLKRLLKRYEPDEPKIPLNDGGGVYKTLNTGHQVFWQDVEDVKPLNSKRRKGGTTLILFIVALSFSALLTSCIRVYEFPKERLQDCYVRTFHWAYAGRPFRATFRIPVSVYDHYDAVPKDLPYEDYACEDPAFPYMDYVVRVLRDSAAGCEFDQRQWAAYLLCFVQSVQYADDPEGPYDYVRYPVLTLMDGVEDCDGKSVLLVTLYSFSGIRSSLVEIPSESHMAASVRFDDDGGQIHTKQTGEFCETTADGWLVGRNSCPGAPVRLTEIPPARNGAALRLRPKRSIPDSEGTNDISIVHIKTEIYEDH